MKAYNVTVIKDGVEIAISELPYTTKARALKHAKKVFSDEPNATFEVKETEVSSKDLCFK